MVTEFGIGEVVVWVEMEGIEKVVQQVTQWLYKC